MNGQLFPTKYLAQNETDLTEYLLSSNPFAKENVGEFVVAWIEYILDTQLTPQQKSKVHNYNILNMNRRRQEIQLEKPELRPSLPEQRRRSYLARGEHLREKA